MNSPFSKLRVPPKTRASLEGRSVPDTPRVNTEHRSKQVPNEPTMPAVAASDLAAADIEVMPAVHPTSQSALKMADSEIQGQNGFNHLKTPMEIYQETVSTFIKRLICLWFVLKEQDTSPKSLFSNSSELQLVVAGLPSWQRMPPQVAREVLHVIRCKQKRLKLFQSKCFEIFLQIN